MRCEICQRCQQREEGTGRANKQRWAKVASILKDKHCHNLASHRKLNKALKMGLFSHWQLWGGFFWPGSRMHSSMVRRLCKSEGNNRHDAIQEKAGTAAGIGCPVRKLGLRRCRACSAPCHGGPGRIRPSHATCTAPLALSRGTKAEPVPHVWLIGGCNTNLPKPLQERNFFFNSLQIFFFQFYKHLQMFSHRVYTRL